MIRRAGALLLCFAFLGASPAQPSSGTIGPASLLEFALAHAATNFTGIRGAKVGADRYQTKYRVNARGMKYCSTCTVLDEFATARFNERWVLSADYTDSARDARAVAAKLVREFGPILRGYAFSSGSGEGGQRWLDWEGPHDSWIYVSTSGSNATGSGYTVRIGHTLAANAHVVQYSRGFSTEDRAEFNREISQFVKLAVDNAPDNFTALRGTKDGDDYEANTNFGPLLRVCRIDGSLSKPLQGLLHRKWTYRCLTPSIGGSPDAAAAIVKDAVQAALPSQFKWTATTPYNDLQEFRWDDSGSATMMVTYSPEPGYATQFTIEFYQFLPDR